MEKPIRTFIAIELSPEIHQTLDVFVKPLIEQYTTGFRWVKNNLMHLTLKFLGDTPISKVPAISQLIEDVCKQTEPFEFQLNSTGAFPNWQRPRTIWAGLLPCAEFDPFFKKMDAVFQQAGFASEGKKFSPHLTLCRVSDYADGTMVQGLRKKMETLTFSGATLWTVNHVTFFKSDLQRGGPIYTPISKHPFMESHKL